MTGEALAVSTKVLSPGYRIDWAADWKRAILVALLGWLEPPHVFVARTNDHRRPGCFSFACCFCLFFSATPSEALSVDVFVPVGARGYSDNRLVSAVWAAPRQPGDVHQGLLRRPL